MALPAQSSIYYVATLDDVASNTTNTEEIVVTDSGTGGRFIKQLASPTADRWNVDGVMLIKDANGTIWERVFEDCVDPEWWGAKPFYRSKTGSFVNDGHDNAPAFSRMLNWLIDTLVIPPAASGDAPGGTYINWTPKPAGVRFKGNRQYGLSATVTWNTRINLYANGGAIFANEGFNQNADAPKALLRLYNEKNRPTIECTLEKLEMYPCSPNRIDSGTGNLGVTAMLFEGDGAAGDFRFCRCVIREAKFYNFRTAPAVQYGARAYLVRFYDTYFSQNAGGDLYYPAGIADAGENFSYTNCTFGNGGVINLEGGAHNFVNCSIDYQQVGFLIKNARVCMLGGHMEINSTNVGSRVVITGRGRFNAVGTKFYGTINVPITAPSYFDAQQYHSRVNLQDCEFENTYGHASLLSGNGQLHAQGCFMVNQNQCPVLQPLTSANNRMLRLQTAEQVTSYLATLYGYAFTGGSYLVQTVQAPAGSGFTGKVIEIRKTAPTSGSQRIAVPMPMGEGRVPYCNLRVMGSEAFNASAGYAFAGEGVRSTSGPAGYYFSNVKNTWNYGSIAVTTEPKTAIGMFGNASDFNVGSGQAPRNIADGSQQWLLFYIDLTNLPLNGSLYIGDINFNVL
ncbi:hypothetical protein [Serratia ficaria]|uniref:hypothetical protein n=1 Tax=Serratia ficaria TaxID=61651 RepID=UPI00077C2172|nr:hypothetical protein [Serratia ficaria]